MDVDEEHSEDSTSMETIMKRSLLAKNKLAIIVKQGNETQYCCVQCPVRSTIKDELEKHLLTHNKEYKHLCGICGTGLKRKEHLDRHTMEHQQVRPHICTICSKAFKRKEHLNVHLSIHSGDKTEVCMLCNKSFYRKDHLQKHLQTHGKILMEQGMQILGDKEILALKSEVIDEVYQNHSSPEELKNCELSDPLWIEPAVNELRPYACGFCPKTYKRKDHLKLHLNTHYKSEGRPCSECGKVFQKEEQLLSHMSVHLNQYPITYNDDTKTDLHAMLAENVIDPATFLTENSLLVEREFEPVVSQPDIRQAAVRQPEAAEERRHECDVCHKRFKRRQHLKVHYNTHTRIEPLLRCLKCNKGFNSDADLDNHQCDIAAPSIPVTGIKIAPATDNRKENQYPVTGCTILPLEPQPEDETTYIIQDESDIPVPQKVFVCKWCSKPFKRKDHYKIHLHIHTGIKSFFCPECGKGFYRKDHLQKHTLVHSGKPKVKKPVPGLLSLDLVKRKDDARGVKPEITITAPSSSKLRVPLQIKVPYQMVMAKDNGERTAVTYDPQSQQIS